MMEIGYWDTSVWPSKECYALPTIKPSRITGEGRMRVRGRDKEPVRDKKKRKRSNKAVKQSRRRNRHK
jgi:hypothetical protein